VHPLLESFGTLFLATLLQKLVVLAHHEAAVLLSRRDTLFSQRAALAAALPPLETVEDLDASRFTDLQPAAVAALMTGGAVGSSLSDVNLEVFDRQAIYAGPVPGPSRPSPLGRPGDVTAVDIEFTGTF